MVSNNYTPEIVEALNDLLGSFFQMNSISDNMAYALDCELNCPCASQVFHLKFAHVFPSDTFADKLSEVMIQEGIRPVRKSLNDLLWNSAAFLVASNSFSNKSILSRSIS